MSEYIVEITGDNSLEDYQLMVNGEENSGAKFVKSSMSFHEHVVTNLVTFLDLPPGQRPARPLLFLKGQAPASDGITPEWAGVLLVAGNSVGVTAYR